jgi:DNA helicase-2/ATP-dependent DNA helicase PcrA
MSELNEPQKSAVLHGAGPLLIFAGAGSGKTRTITFRIAHLLASHGVPPYRILAVTFTNKAAGEMRHRLEELAGPEIARDLWVGTFHGICAKLLRRYPEEAGLDRSFVIYDDADQKAVVARVTKDLGLDERRYPPKYVLSLIGACKREGQDPTEVDVGDGFDTDLANLAREYQRALARANAVDFEDLLLRVMRLVENPDSVAGRDLRRKFEHVLVDEFQDTNLVQYRIVRALSSATRNLCVVGDDDQSIYRWRGADVRIIRGFRRDFPDASVVKLEQNYRSSGNIVRAALGVIEPALDREPKKLWTAAEPGAPVVVRSCPDERAEAAWVASGVAQARAHGVNTGELAIFYRVHAQSRVLEEALRAEMLPYQVIGGMKFFERAEVKDLLSYLRFLENPKSDADLLRIINVPARGIGPKTVSALLDAAAENTTSAYGALTSLLRQGDLLGAAAQKKLQAFADLVDELRAAKEELTPKELAERVLEATGYKAALQEADSAESDARLENLAELIGSIAEYEAEAPEAGEEPTLAGYLERVSLVAAVDSLQDTPAVSLMTVHSAKGLEFDTVWLTGMEEETFPYRGLDGTDPEELDEERRLAYVAITRARRRLFISHVLARTLFGKTKYLQRSRFLDDLPPDVVERQGEARPSLAPSAGSWAGNRGRESSAWGATRARPGGDAGRPWGVGAEPGAQNASAGGRVARSELRLAPGERVVDREAFDDVPQDGHGEDVIVRPGDRVRHAKFGRGVVERVEAGAAPSVVARFPGYGSKRILAQFLDFE